MEHNFFNFWNGKFRIHKICSKNIPKGVIWKSFFKGIKYSFPNMMGAEAICWGCGKKYPKKKSKIYCFSWAGELFLREKPK